MHWRLLCLANVLLLLHCERVLPATEVIVVVHTDLEPGEDLDALEVRLLDPDDTGNDAAPHGAFSVATQPRAGQHTMPLSFSVAPKDPYSESDFRLVVTGLRDGEPVVEQQVIATFRRHKSLQLEMFLTRTCLRKLCHDDDDGERGDRVCNREGICEQLKPIKALPEWEGGRTELDGGLLLGPDAGDKEVGNVDAGREPDAEPRGQAYLTDLRASAGVLTPAFSPTQTAYRLRIPQTRLEVAFELGLPSGATAELDGELGESHALGLVNRPTSFEIAFTISAPGRDPTTYGVTVTHAFAPPYEVVRPSATPGPDSQFGGSLAIHGDILAIGDAAAYPTDQPAYAGAVHIYERDGGRFSFRTTLPSATDGLPTDQRHGFGNSVAFDGDSLVVGEWLAAPDTTGRAHVYARTADGWGSRQTLTPVDATGLQHFGWSTAVLGDTIAVGAYAADVRPAGADGLPLSQAGQAFVFTRDTSDASGWIPGPVLQSPDPKEQAYFGFDVALSERWLVVGSHLDSTVHVFDGSRSWEHARGFGGQVGEQLGFRVAIDGDTFVSGARFRSDTGRFAGAAEVYTYATEWEALEDSIHADPPGVDDCFGGSVALNGDVLVVGAPYAGDSIACDAWPDLEKRPDLKTKTSGAVYLLHRVEGKWTITSVLRAEQLGLGETLLFGSEVALHGDTLIVGAVDTQHVGAIDGHSFATRSRGRVYVFE